MISTYAELLSEQYSGKFDDKADKYIHYAVDGAVRMLPIDIQPRSANLAALELRPAHTGANALDD
jgi:hypothetical protein